MSQAELWLRFGPFSLYPARKALMERGAPVRLGGRALDLLITLVEHAGECLSKEDLVAAVWPTTVVEETSLRVHVMALRKALGDGQSGARYISNIPGRGYCFVARVERVAVGAASGSARCVSGVPRHNLPARLTRIVGRDEATVDLIAKLDVQRLLTITGPGGIGKTTVALAVAESVLPRFQDGVIFVDLAPLSDAALVPTAVAAALQFTLLSESDDLTANLCNAMAKRQMLVVLDNCEHVIDLAVTLIEKILKAAPDVRVLATSREPLRAEAEWVYRLEALELPDAKESPTLASARRSPAVELFVERAMASCDGFQLTHGNVTTVLDICRQLDGIPLAIELAAGRVDSLGIDELADRLVNRLRILTNGLRLARPRHRTLRALIDWSHDLLTESERVVFRRLSVFRTGFSLEAAADVVGCSEIQPPEVIDCVLSLAAKSLVTTDASGDVVLHRLLYSTNAYAADKLKESNEGNRIAERHAAHCLALMAQFLSANARKSFAERVAQHHRISDDVRAAISWAICDDGNVALAVKLSLSAIQSALDSGAYADEYGGLLEQALEKLARQGDRQPQLELAGLSVLCLVSGHSSAVNRPHGDLLARTLALSERSESTDDRISALFGGVSAMFGGGHYLDAQRLVERLRCLTIGEHSALGAIITDRMSVLVNHCLGEHEVAMALSVNVCSASLDNVPRRFIPPVPASAAMGVIRARTLWLRGYPDQAVAEVDQALECTVVNGIEHAISVCQVLVLGVIPIAIWRGDLDKARDALARLKDLASRASLSFWHSWLRSFEAAVAQRSGYDVLRDGQWALIANPVELDHLGTFSDALVSERTVARVAAGEVGWCAPEILRIQGERRLLRDDEDARSEGEGLLQRSLELARTQQALGWELRAATSLGRHWWAQGRANEARELVMDVLDRCTEGSNTTDPVAARALLQAMASNDLSPVEEYCPSRDQAMAPSPTRQRGARVRRSKVLNGGCKQ